MKRIVQLSYRSLASFSFISLICLGSMCGCQRQLPNELPYDAETSETVRDDFSRLFGDGN